MKQVSASGRFRVGDLVEVPEEYALCGGHTLTVVNACYTKMLTVTREWLDDGVPMRESRGGEVDCLLMRCVDCLRSWSVPDLESVEVTAPFDEMTRAVWIELGAGRE